MSDSSGAPSCTAWAASGPNATTITGRPLSVPTTRSASARSLRRSNSERAWPLAARFNASIAGLHAGASALFSTATSAARAHGGSSSRSATAHERRGLVMRGLLDWRSCGRRPFAQLRGEDLLEIHQDDEAILQLGHPADGI